MAHDPANVRGRPPHIGRLHPEHPVPHAPNEHLIGAVRVDGELGPGCGAGRGQDVGRLVGFHGRVRGIPALPQCQEVLPPDVAALVQGHVAGPAQHDHALHRLARRVHGIVDDPLEPDVAPFTVGHVRGEERPGSAEPEALAQRATAKPREDHQVNGADARRRQHQRNRLGAGGHVDGDAITFADAQAAQRGREVRDGVQKLRVGVLPALAPLVQGDQSRVATAAGGHVPVQAVVAQVGLGAEEPAKGRRIPLEHPVPGAKPRQLVGRARPEALRIRGRLALPHTYKHTRVRCNPRVTGCHPLPPHRRTVVLEL